VLAGTADAVMMVEGQASQVPEERIVEAVLLAHEEIKRIVEVINDLQREVGKPKREFTAPEGNLELTSQIEEFIGDRLGAAVFNPDKEQRIEATAALRSEVLAHFTQVDEAAADVEVPSQKEVSGIYQDLVKGMVRRAILERGERPDGRKPDEIREIWGQVGYLPRTHGSAIFTRGQTQAVSIATLGTSSEEQMIDGLGLEESKRYMHHYNFPPYSVGEARFMRGPSRRDIGHGVLAERALLAVLPSEADFPYTMRVVSEIVSSNGSTSMASVCGSTMALMDAGVPITAPVAGMAMGLITDAEAGNYTVLSDIQGMEDALGDMDFKVAGSADGVTAIQMDIKVQGITADIMREALEQARRGRLFILSKIAEVIDAPRGDMSEYAPRITRIKIPQAQIGALIGPGGKTVRGIQDETGAKIEIEEDGTVFISSVNRESSAAAIERVERLTKVPEAGEIYSGKVKTIIPSGAFVEILPGKDGFVHISELEPFRVERVEDVVQVGDEVNVIVTQIRPDGKINLSRKQLLVSDGGDSPSRDRGPRGDQGGDDRRSDDRRGGGRGRDDRRDGGGRGPRGQQEGRGRPGGPGGDVRRDVDGQRRDGGDGPRRDGEGQQFRRRPRDSRIPPGRD
jgi:polyribonucleotide nucleotidyltransferase